MDFMHRLFVMVGHRTDSAPSRYSTFVDEQSERLVELVLSNAAKAVETARRSKIRQRPRESDIIIALIDKLQDAGF